jgi:hypothetical protein
MRQIRPSSMGGLGVAQATMPTGRQGPLSTVPYDGKNPASLTESQTTANVEAEIANFEVEAYGAVLGVIYYRVIGDAARAAWDRRMQAAIDRARNQITAIMNQGQGNWNAAHTNGPSAAFSQSYQRLGAQKQAVQQHLDFLVALQGVKQQVFSSSRFAAFNDDKIVAKTPWCQCDAEFRFTAWQMLSGEASAAPVLNRGFDTEQREKTLREQIAAAFNTILTAKVTDYIDEFLDMGVDLLKGSMREGVELVIRNIPIVDVIVDIVKDLLAEAQIKSLIEAYRQDEQRRYFLTSLHWADYERLAPVGVSQTGIPRGVAAR